MKKVLFTSAILIALSACTADDSAPIDNAAAVDCKVTGKQALMDSPSDVSGDVAPVCPDEVQVDTSNVEVNE